MASRTPSPRAKIESLGELPTTLGGRGWGTPASTLQSGANVRLARICPSCLERYPGDFRVCPRDATELSDVEEDDEADPLLGVTVGDTFSIVRVIGEGGMARVYEARHVRLPNKRFAVKVLHQMYAQQSNIVARFQREAEASSGIGHPNVVDVYDVGITPDGRPFLVSEYLEGKDFATLLDERERIDAGVAVHVVRQVCRALAAAHARGVVHRDVKPENVFLVGDMESPVVKVLDFGISKFDGGGGATLTQTGMIMGTPGYMPPEQARGAKTDHRADIYGVGAMLYRATTGKLPFDSEDATEALSMVLTAEPPRPRSVQPSIPEALELVIEKAMAKNPDERYRSMAELDERLAPFDPETPSSVSLLPPGPGSRLSRKNTVAAATVRSGSGTTDVEQRTREAKLARPTMVFLTLVAYVWLLGCVVDAGTSALAAFRGVSGTTPTEKLVVGIVTVAISLAPLVFWLRHVQRVWANSVRSVALAKSLRRVVLAATVPYAFIALALRVVMPLSDLRWAPVPAALSLVVAAFVQLTSSMGRRDD
ncbi:MAG TPA: serine/threonine-protein kinase [Polyangiaceae bacterium]|jgi:serine/threonine-protein kinase|nr:serine/threonine-protein kinase [Polyangiaceae bacterium]